MTAIFIGIRFCATLFHQNRTSFHWYVARQRFQNSGRLPSWILEIYSLCHMTFFGMLFCFIWQKFAEIGRSIAEVCRKNDFEDGNRPPSWILNICCFCHAAFAGIAYRSASSYKISLKSDNRNRLTSYGQKKRFSRWRPPPSWILKNHFLVMWLSSGSTSAVVYQISSKSDDFYRAILIGL